MNLTKCLSAMIISLMAVPAFADVNTVCLGGGTRGNDIKIEIIDQPGDLKIRVNDQLVNASRDGQVGTVLLYSYDGAGRVFFVEYDYQNATAELRGQGPIIALFCSRGVF